MATTNIRRALARSQGRPAPTLFDGPVRVPLSGERGRGRVALVSPADADLVRLPWHLNSDGYATTSANEDRAMARVILSRWLGPPPDPDMEADHKNGDRLDNQRHNLRWATRAQNLRNRRFKKKRAEGKRRGINRLAYKDGTPFYQPALYVAGTQVQLGSYPDEDTAARVYDAYAAVYYGPFAVLNFPDDAPWSLATCDRVREAVARRRLWAPPAHEKLDAMLEGIGLPPRSAFP